MLMEHADRALGPLIPRVASGPADSSAEPVRRYELRESKIIDEILAGHAEDKTAPIAALLENEVTRSAQAIGQKQARAKARANLLYVLAGGEVPLSEERDT